MDSDYPTSPSVVKDGHLPSPLNLSIVMMSEVPNADVEVLLKVLQNAFGQNLVFRNQDQIA